jgi:hypothetical protein
VDALERALLDLRRAVVAAIEEGASTVQVVAAVERAWLGHWQLRKLPGPVWNETPNPTRED